MRKCFIALLYSLSPVLLAKYRFLRILGRRLNLKDPQSFDEKLFWLMLYWRHPLKVKCTDKYTMRSYVKEHGLDHMLPKLLGVYENSSEINFDILPNRFILKCTHGCGFNIICTEKSELDIEKTICKLDAWMKVDFSKVYGEIHYALINPRIICECFLGDSEGNLPIDYKVYCFNGKAYCTNACLDRSSDGHQAIYYIYDREWKNKLPFDKTSLNSRRNIPKPANYDEMIAAAEKLSTPFPFVRIDFYSINGKAVIGEMTFSPSGCIDQDLTDIGQRILGELIKLPKKYL
jgi:hypothetical protein